MARKRSGTGSVDSAIWFIAEQFGGPRRVLAHHRTTANGLCAAFSEDRRILRQWELDLSVGGRIAIPDGTRTVQVHDPETTPRTRVDLGQVGRRRPA